MVFSAKIGKKHDKMLQDGDYAQEMRFGKKNFFCDFCKMGLTRAYNYGIINNANRERNAPTGRNAGVAE